jgi:hypothetical protein
MRFKIYRIYKIISIYGMKTSICVQLIGALCRRNIIGRTDTHAFQTNYKEIKYGKNEK